MRQRRQLNKTEASEAKDLMREDGPLSSTEQEHVLRYLADMLRGNAIFLAVVSAAHILIAILYIAMVLNGSALIYFSWDSSSSIPASSHRTLEKSVGGGGDNRGDLFDSPVQHDDLKMGGKMRAEPIPYNPTSSGGLNTPPIGAVVTTLVSALLLFVGGAAAYRASAYELAVDADALVSAKPAARHAKEKKIGTAPLLTRSKDGVEVPAAAASSKRSIVGRITQMFLISPREILRAAPSVHRKCLRLALCCSLYWIVALCVYHQHLAHQQSLSASPLRKTLDELNHRSGSESETVWLTAAVRWVMSCIKSTQTGLYFGITDDFLELLLLTWQPFFHLFMASVTASMFGTKADLQQLAALKYTYERV